MIKSRINQIISLLKNNKIKSAVSLCTLIFLIICFGYYKIVPVYLKKPSTKKIVSSKKNSEFHKPSANGYLLIKRYGFDKTFKQISEQSGEYKNVFLNSLSWLSMVFHKLNNETIKNIYIQNGNSVDSHKLLVIEF